MQAPKSIAPALVQEGQRVMSICNACRYCEGYCAVFPALERRLRFSEDDLVYLANLCHHCGACYAACQYAPPHEFALNFPKTLAQIRIQSYQKYTWPGFLADLFKHNGVAVGLITVASVVLTVLVTLLFVEPSLLFTAHDTTRGSFYAVIPHAVMAWLFGAVALYVFVACTVGVVRFWRDTRAGIDAWFDPRALTDATSDAFTLRYLGGGGEGCADYVERPSQRRRWFHHLTSYGFLLCFAATTIATVYHYVFGWKAPYPMWSLPVVLGTVGGVGLLIGPAGLLWLRRQRDPDLSDQKQRGMDIGFLVLLWLTSLTGLLLLVLRETSVMGLLLALHLGVVLGLFLSLPYGKFVHAFYRLAALLRYSLERRHTPPQRPPE